MAESTKDKILTYLRYEFEEDIEYSRKDIRDICDTLEIAEQEAREALDELQADGKVYYFQDCGEPHDEEWQACGASVVWDLP